MEWGTPGLVGYRVSFVLCPPGAWKQKKPTPLDRGPSLHVKQALRSNDAYGNENNKQNNNFVRASRFIVHFFARFARLRRENA